MTARTAPPFRADHVGSFLRPQALLEARDECRKGERTRAAAARRRGRRDPRHRPLPGGPRPPGITDGEFRRTYFHIDFLEQLEGVETKGGIAVSFHSAHGNVDFAPPVMQVTGPGAAREADPAAPISTS